MRTRRGEFYDDSFRVRARQHRLEVVAVPIEGWRRREDLEGGKQIRIWLRDDGTEELYVENLTYRDEGYAVYVYDVEEDEWETIAETDSRADAVERATDWAGS